MYVKNSYLKGHHVSKHYWTLTNRETFVCKREPEKAINAFTVAVIIVGHIPRKISEAFSLFLHRNGSIVHVGNAINALYIGGF